ncbi:hypothetical protein O9992_27735 [Vibrio lentus]|nr:hypothetical protein [Vibrio lentus]
MQSLGNVIKQGQQEVEQAIYEAQIQRPYLSRSFALLATIVMGLTKRHDKSPTT